MTVSPDLSQSRLKVLDGLRAVAILLVLVRHSLIALFMSYQYPLPYIPLFTPFLLNAWCGVDLFFVLSGFLIARQLLAGDGICHFYKKLFCGSPRRIIHSLPRPA